MNLHKTLKKKRNLRNLELGIYITLFVIIVILFLGLFFKLSDYQKLKVTDEITTEGATLTLKTKSLYMNFKNVDDTELYYGSNIKSGKLISSKEFDNNNGRYTMAIVSTKDDNEIYDCTAKFTIVANSNIDDINLKNIKVSLTGLPVSGGNETYTLDELINKKTIILNFKGVSSTISESVLIEVYKEDNVKIDSDKKVEIHINKVDDEFSCTSR